MESCGSGRPRPEPYVRMYPYPVYGLQRVLLLMGIHYRGAGDVDELGYVYVNGILDVRVNVRGCYTRCTC